MRQCRCRCWRIIPTCNSISIAVVLAPATLRCTERAASILLASYEARQGFAGKMPAAGWHSTSKRFASRGHWPFGTTHLTPLPRHHVVKRKSPGAKDSEEQQKKRDQRRVFQILARLDVRH